MTKNSSSNRAVVPEAKGALDRFKFEVANELGVSKSYAYKVVRELNTELQKLGYLTVSGRVNTNFFRKKLCYSE